MHCGNYIPTQFLQRNSCDPELCILLCFFLAAEIGTQGVDQVLCLSSSVTALQECL